MPDFRALTTLLHSALRPLALAGVVLLALMLRMSVAASLTVTTTVDENNGNTSSIAALLASPGGSGISLREAILAANSDAASGPHTITVPAGVYTLSGGQITISSALTITGAGATGTVIDAQGGGRIFNITGSGGVTLQTLRLDRGNIGSGNGATISNTNGNLTLTNVNITNGWSGGNGGGISHGGGVLTITGGSISSVGANQAGGVIHLTGGSLVISGTSFTNNSANNSHGGVINASSGNVTISSSTFTSSWSGGSGGVLYYSGSGSIALTDNSFVDNNANSAGGVIWAGTGTASLTASGGTWTNNGSNTGNGGSIVQAGGSLSVSATSVSSGGAGGSGGFLHYTGSGTVNLDGISASDNWANTQAGVAWISSSAAITVSGSSFNRNSSNGDGGVLRVAGGGALALSRSNFGDSYSGGSGGSVMVVSSGGAVIDRVGISASWSNTNGGGIDQTAGPLQLSNSTISGGGSNNGDGGGLRYVVSSGTATLSNLTVSGGWSGGSGGGLFIGGTSVTATLTNLTIVANGSSGAGGGLRRGAGTVSLRNTLISGNSSSSGSGANCSGTLSSLGNNLDSGSTCGFSASGDLSNANANLAALANNGGTTLTHALQTGSAAINAGTSTSAPSTDQRGFSRVGATDIGAFEFAGSAPVPLALPLYLVGSGVPTATLSGTAPTAGAPANVDPDRDSAAGLLLSRGGTGVNESDPRRVQTWLAPAGAISLSGNVNLLIWSAVKDFRTDKSGALTAFLLDCASDGSSCTTIATATRNDSNWSGGASGWVQKTLGFTGLSYSVSSTRRLGLRVVVPGSSDDDLMLAYDSTATPSRLEAAVAASVTVSGTVFEDLNYGGGAGRSLAASSGVGRGGATVELYNASGSFVTSTTSASNGSYSFTSLTAGSYFVRVVSTSVLSSRTGASSAALPVMTFRTNATSGSAVAVTDWVGGTNPALADAAAASTGATLNTSSYVFSAGPSGTAQAVAPVTVGSTNVTGVDFGFNFSTVVNTNDSGAGSLRQFIVNSNTLGGQNLLAQAGSRVDVDQATQSLPSGTETSIFMIPGGSAVAGLRSGLASQLTSGVAVIAWSSTPPTLTSARVAIDGGTQTANVGNSNSGLVGAGGTVGADALTLGQVPKPEVQLSFGSSSGGLTLNANDLNVRGLAIVASGNTNVTAVTVSNNVTGTLIEGNVLGSTAAGNLADPGAANRLYGGIVADGADSGSARRNVIAWTERLGIQLANSAASWTVEFNEIRDGGWGNNDHDGMWISSTSATTIRGNRISGSSSQGVVVTTSASNAATLINNTITGNGVGSSSSAPAQTHAIAARSGVTSLRLEANLIQANYGTGVGVNSGASGIVLTRNLIFGNGQVLSRNGSAASGVVDIDLNSSSDNAQLGTAPFVTANDSGDGDSGGNNLQNFPLLSTATLSGSTLTVRGSINSAANRHYRIEFFGAGTQHPSGHGGGSSYLGSVNVATNGSGDGSFTFTLGSGAPAAGSAITATATRTDASYSSDVETSEYAANVVVRGGIAGAVFEDLHYGGGAGRSRAASGGAGVSAARVELYNSSGAFVSATSTASDGSYNFPGLTAGTWYVRVASQSVRSTRSGSSASLRAVMTYRTDGSSGSAVAVTDWVGGTAPASPDPGDGGSGTTLNTTSYAFTVGLSGHAHALAAVTVGSTEVAGMDFGFHFATVVNSNDSGQGSLRQAMLNANALGNDTTLVVAGRTAGAEHIVFMLPNGSTGGAGGGLRASLNAFSGGVATIVAASALPQVSASVVIDARTQPGWSTRPIIEINGTGAGSGVHGFDVVAGNSTVAGFVINRFSNAGINLWGGGSNRVLGNWLGLNAAGTAAAGNVEGLNIWDSASNVVGGVTAAERNVIAGNSNNGIVVGGTSGGGNTFRGNWLGLDGSGANQIKNGSLGIYVNSTGNTFGGSSAGQGNVIGGSTWHHVYLDSGASGNTLQGNVLGRNAGASSSFSVASHAIFVLASNNTIGGSSTSAANTITAAAGAAVAVTGNVSGNAVLGNSLWGNASPGIDLGANGATSNDGAKTSGQPNLLMDSPVITVATLAGTTLTVAGHVGSAAGQATFAGARVEVFVADPAAAGTGQGRVFIGTLTADGSGNFSGNFSNVSGISVGSTWLTATATDGSNNTSEFGSNTVVANAPGIGGRVFEDRNYGGGAGRSLADSGGTGVAGARVELYDSSGVFVSATTSAGDGSYSFTGLAAGSYRVRVVATTVLSTRSGAGSGVIGVLTYRTDASSGSAAAVTNAVGGTHPALADAGNGGSGSTLNTATGVFTAGITGTAHALSPVQLGSSSIAGVDFGFNFSTVTNTNDSGQGSLRQWILNANALGDEAGLAQAGLTAGRETTVFQMPTSDAGHNGSRWRITVATALPVLTSADAVIDGSTQTGTVLGNLWAGSAHTLKVELFGNGQSFDGLRLSGTRSGVRAMVINGFANSAAGVRISGGSSAFVRSSHIGTDVAGNTLVGMGDGVLIDGNAADAEVGGNGSSDGNVIVGTGGTGVISHSGNTGVAVRGNFIGSNATGTAVLGRFTHSNINHRDGSATYREIRRNLVVGAERGIAFDNNDSITPAAGQARVLIVGNHVGVNRAGTAALGSQTVGITIGPTDAGVYADLIDIGGSAAGEANVIGGNGTGIAISGDTRNLRILGNVIGRNAAGLGAPNSGDGISVVDSDNVLIGGLGSGQANVIASNGGRGIVLTGSAEGVTMRGNSIFDNTGIGIDLGGGGVTPNDGQFTANWTNRRIDHPVLYQAVVGSSTLTVIGHVGSAYGQTVFAGTTVDLYLSDNHASGYGSGRTWLGSLTADANGMFSGSFAPAAAVAAGARITATTTDSSGNTSEFGPQLTSVALQAFRNGSFEQTSIAPGASFATHGAGVTAIDGWVTRRGGIDHIGGYWPPAQGQHSVDTNAVSAGGIQQTFLTVPGQLYTVLFALAGNPDCGTPTKTLTVSAAGTSTTQAFDASGNTLQAMRWIERSLSFTATSEATTLVFDSQDMNACGPAVDDVRLVDGTPRVLSGTVFEDRHYGGGAGRSLAASGGSPVARATVELYDTNGNFVRMTSTDSTGLYRFSGLTAGTWHVRVASTTVASTRSGSSASLIGVMTYRSDASGGTALPVSDRVGGTNPAQADPGVAASGAAFHPVSRIYSSGLSGTAHAVTTVALAAADIPNLDFGFSFNVIVNTRDAGQGSLRQYLLNAAALADTGLAQAGLTAGVDNAVFMIADGTARPGLSASYASLFSGGVATIRPLSALPTVTGRLSAQTQPGWADRPLIELDGSGAGSGVHGLSVGAGAQVRGFIVNRFGGHGISAAGTGVGIHGNWIGLAASGTSAAGNGLRGVDITLGSNHDVGGSTVAERNVISGNGSAGSDAASRAGIGATVPVRLRGNYVGTNAAGSAAVGNLGHGVFASTAMEVFGPNVISGNAGWGVYFSDAGNDANARLEGTWVGVAADGSSALGNALGGVYVGAAQQLRIGMAAGSSTGAGIYAHNGGPGVLVNTGAGRVRISGNAIHGNATLGIDLGGDGLTPNDGSKSGSTNQGMDAPVFSSARARGNQLTVAGYVGSAAGQSVFAGARVEVFISDNDPSGHGEGRVWLGALTTDASGNFSGTLTLPVAALAVGTRLSGTAIDGNGNTSEFGPAFTGLLIDFVVNHNGDDPDAKPGDGLCDTGKGICTLRAAMEELNAIGSQATRPTIAFELPGCKSAGDGACVISPASALPVMKASVAIDGSTQPGFDSKSCAPLVELDGSGTAASVSGLVVSGDRSRIQALVIRRFGASGITLADDSAGHEVFGNRIGTDASGQRAEPNGQYGIEWRSSDSIIGGPQSCEGNLLSGNQVGGVFATARGGQLLGNRIGPTANDKEFLPSKLGIYSVDSTDIVIGGADGAMGNTVAGHYAHGLYFEGAHRGVTVASNSIHGNSDAGIAVSGPSAQVRIEANTMWDNGGLGIDLGPDGVDANSGSYDPGRPNAGMNQPVITGAGIDPSGTTLTVYGYVGTSGGSAVFAGATVEFFKAAVDGSGHGEGQVFLGRLSADANGRISGSLSIPAGALSVGDPITATATDGDGNTSEFGPNWTTTSVAALSPGGFNAFDSSTAAGSLTGPLTTRVAGAASSVDIVALNAESTGLHPGFTGNVTLTWLDARNDSGAANGSCRSSWVALGTAGTASFNDASRVSVGLTPPASGTQVMRLMMSHTNAGGITTTACSGDAFAVIPASFSFAATDANSSAAGNVRNLTNTAASGGVVHRAGRPFLVTSMALDASGGLMTGYTGSPTVTVVGCQLPAGCTAGALTQTATAASNGVYANASLRYFEVGVVRLELTDISYAAVDSADTALANRSIRSAPADVGRFVPDSFSVSVSANGQFATANAACLAPGSGATFIGQAFGWNSAPQVTVTAKAANGSTTTLWTGALMKLTGSGQTPSVTVSAAGSATAASSFGAISVTDLGAGQARLGASALDRFVLELPAGSSQPSVTPAWTWQLAITDASEAGVSGNPTLSASASQSAVPFNLGALFHSGRLVLNPGHGDARSGVRVGLELQRLASAGWVTMTEDRGCVTVQPQHLGVESPSGVFASAGVCVAPFSGSATTQGGRAWLPLPATPAAAEGRITLRLAGAAATGQACSGPGTTQPLAALPLPWLLGGASGTGPTALATWGRPNREALLRRETW